MSASAVRVGSLADDRSATTDVCYGPIPGARRLFDRLINSRKELRWQVEPKHSGGLGIDDQLKLGCLYDRQICGLRALENTTGINADLPVGIRNVGGVAH